LEESFEQVFHIQNNESTVASSLLALTEFLFFTVINLTQEVSIITFPSRFCLEEPPLSSKD
jgi:hypothetical protein